MAKKPVKWNYQIDEILDHLNEVSKTLTEEGRDLRDNFNDLCSEEKLGKQKSSLILKYASPSARHDIGTNTRLNEFWHFLGDVLKTQIAPLRSKFDSFRNFTEEQKQESLMTIVLSSRWNAHNFPLIMGFNLPEDVPAYGTRLGKISNVPSFLAYMHRSVSPVIVNALAHTQGITPEQVETKIAEHEKKIVKGGLAGLEVIQPVPIKAWNRLSLEKT